MSEVVPYIRALLPDGSLPAESRAHVDAQVDARVAQQVPTAVTAEVAQQIPPLVEAAVSDPESPAHETLLGIIETVVPEVMPAPGYVILTQADQPITLTDEPTSAVALIQDEVGSRTAAWPTSVTWEGAGITPTLQTAPGATDVFTFLHAPDGRHLGLHSASFPPPPAGEMDVTYSVTDTTITLDWPQVANAFQYEVRAAGRPVVETENLRHVIAGLTPSTAYTVEVRATLLDLSHTAWRTLNITTAAPLPVAIGDDFDAPDGTPLNGRVTPVGGATITSPDFLTGGGNGEGTITNGRFYYSGTGGSPQIGIPITSRNLRIAMDYNITDSGFHAVHVGIGNGNTDGVVVNIAGTGLVRYNVDGGAHTTIAPGGTAPRSGRLEVKFDGAVLTVVIDGQVIGAPVTVPVKAAAKLGISLTSGEMWVDNLEVAYL